MPYLDDTIKLLVSCQEGDLDSDDPQKKYLLSGWMRLCEQYHPEIAGFLPSIMPTLLKIIQKIFDQDDDAEEGELGGTTSL